jgi:hypothetical protein
LLTVGKNRRRELRLIGIAAEVDVREHHPWASDLKAHHRRSRSVRGTVWSAVATWLSALPPGPVDAVVDAATR